MTKAEAFYILWFRYNYVMTGINYHTFYNSMSKKEILARLAEEESDSLSKKESE